MITVQLKVKHIYFIANELKNIAVSKFFALLNRMKLATADKQNEETVSVDVSANDLLSIYRIIAAKPEGQCNLINTEMNDMLLPQVQSGAQTNNDEWLLIASEIPDIRQANWDMTASAISEGKAFLNQ